MIYAVLFAAGASALPQETTADPKPQKQHQLLNQFEGDWEVRSKWMMPGKAIDESTGTDRSRMGFGGFWLVSDFTGQMEGKPFKGHSMMGYDPQTAKYVSVCIGDNAPHLTRFEGQADASGKKFTFDGQCVDPKTGKLVSQRVICEVTDKDHHTNRVYTIGEDGKETLIGEFFFTRTGKPEAK
jgi:hypothetical protein